MLSPIRESRQDFDNIDYLNINETCSSQKKKHSDNDGMTGLSCVGVLWALLSFISLVLSLTSFFMPYWIEGSIESINLNGNNGISLSETHHHQQTNQQQVVSATTSTNFTNTYFGLWRRCNYHILSSNGYIDVEYACGRYTTFTDIPTVWWKIATVATGFGCLLSMFISFLGMLACCISNVMSNSLAKTVGVLQFIAGISITLGCVLFPFGWENNLELQQACGADISVYQLGECRICWSYWVAVSGGGLTLLCSLLGCYSAKQKTRLRYDRVGL